MLHMNNLSIGKKLVLFGIIGTAVPLVLLGGFALWNAHFTEEYAKKCSNEMALKGFDHIIEGVYATVSAQQEQLEQTLASNLKVAAEVLTNSGGMVQGEGTTSWQARNQFSAAEQTVQLPTLRIGEQVVTVNNDPKTPSLVVDKIQGMVGGACTLFQRMNDAGDMLRVVTNVASKDGRRTINTFIPAVNPDGKPNPVVAKALAGERYVDRAFVVNAWYASSTEEMTATASEIAESAEKARVITDAAVKQSQSTSIKMSDLEASAKKIGRVTEAITEISEQTNLLALNATIEDMARISEVIVEINTVINTIATAVEEQSTATSEIAGNIAQASQGIAEVNENMAQSTLVVDGITRDITKINQQSSQVDDGSGQVQERAQELADLAVQLEGLVAKFTIRPPQNVPTFA